MKDRFSGSGSRVLSVLNFIGCVKEAKLLDPLGEWGRKHGLTATHNDVFVSDADFTAKVLDGWTRR